MAGPDRQFDPVANASLSALRASNRGIRQVQKNTPAPELPEQSQAVRSLRSGISSASAYSPFNTLLSGDGPSLPGMDDGGGAEALPTDIPGLETELPDPAGVFGEGVTLSDLAPQNIMDTLSNSGVPSPPTPGNGGGGGGGGGSGSGGSSGGSGDANAPGMSRGAGASR